MPTNTTTNQPLYFPPPPSSAMKDAEAKKNLKFNFTRSKPSKDTTVMVTSIQEPPKSILKKKTTPAKRTRQWILLSLLVVSFTILILSTIFAYCAALPHSDNVKAAQAAAASAASTTTPITSTVSLISVSTATSTSTPDPVSLLLRDTPKHTDTYSQSVEAALAEDASNQQRFGTSSAMAALTFYTATLPFLTMLHTSVELLTSLIRPETSQKTRLGDALRFRHAGADVGARGVVTRRRIGTLLSFSASALLCLGWLIMQVFWVNCEISTFGGASAEQVCPIQIRGHRMGGVSELSIGKVVLGFVVVIGYMGYCMYLVKCVGVFSSTSRLTQAGPGPASRMSSFRRRARFACQSRNEDTERGDVESVVIGIDMDKDMR